jgi:hypothetical protein
VRVDVEVATRFCDNRRCLITRFVELGICVRVEAAAFRY